jgi:hypothetical protein
VEKWIADLGNDQFEVREQATRELRNLGVLVEPALRKAIDRTPPPELEARRRLDVLLEEVARGLSTEERRSVRGVEVLGRLGTAEAEAVLRVLAHGATAAPATITARAALDRLGR